MNNKLFVFAALLALGSCASNKLKQQENEIALLKTDKGKLTGDLKRREERLAALENDIHGLEGRIKELGDKLKASQTQIDSLTQSNKDLSQSMESNKDQLATKVKELVSAKDELSRKLAEAQKEIATLKTARDQFQREANALRVRTKTLDAELAPLKLKQEEEMASQETLEINLRAQAENLTAAFQKEIETGHAKVETLENSVALSLADGLIFEPQEEKVLKNASTLLGRVGQALREAGWPVRIESHSDNTPMKKGLLGGFASNWELTAARAGTLARYLVEKAGLEAARVKAVGFGDSRPAMPNDTPEGQAANRRIVFALTPKAKN